MSTCTLTDLQRVQNKAFWKSKKKKVESSQKKGKKSRKRVRGKKREDIQKLSFSAAFFKVYTSRCIE